MDSTSVLQCIAGFLLVYAYDDLSYNQPATQSYTYIQVGNIYAAGNAVDRNSTTCMRTQPIGLNSPEKSVWWKVDLGGVYNIYSINVLFKNYGDWSEIRQRGRFAGFTLYVSTTGDMNDSTLCYKNGPELPPLSFTTTCTVHGRYVIFYNERLAEVSYPPEYEIENVYTELCEVIVQGCNRPGVYGNKCNIFCPINCKDNTCHIQNGTCFGCKPGWTGTSCNINCKEWSHGNNCSQKCIEHCKDNTTCNHVTGHCERGCKAGWTGSSCDKECVNGTYGYDCVKKCSGHCLYDTPCNKKTGVCDRECNPGYFDTYCSRECYSGYFGLDCRNHCHGYCMNNEPCDHVSGFCLMGCMDGYTGDHCNIDCEAGYYGKNCSLSCLPNCKTCRHTDGLCTCKAGWMADNCTTECIQSYGENCQYPCSKHCSNHQCDRFNGKCTDSVLRFHTNDAADCKIWIVAFSLSLVTSVIFISVTIILRRKLSLQQKSSAGDVNLYWRCGSNTEQNITTDDASHYQDLCVSRNENTYQTIDQH